jgi:hypothetical protein
MMKGESELAARASFERMRWNSSAWENHGRCIRDRSKLDIPRQSVGQQLILGEFTLIDDGVNADYWVRSNLGLSARGQHERWYFPLIQANVSRIVTAAAKIPFEPNKLYRHSVANRLGAALGKGDRP